MPEMRKEWTPEAFVRFIDQNFNQAKKEGLSRFSAEWGLWSRKMNLAIRERIESGNDPQEVKLKQVFIYWTQKSEMLELHLEKRLLNGGKIKRLKKDIERCRKLILQN